MLRRSISRNLGFDIGPPYEGVARRSLLTC